jgi:hypothetical protein
MPARTWMPSQDFLDANESFLNIHNLIIIPDFKVLKTVAMKFGLFWDVNQCSVIQVHERCGRMYCFHLQGQSIGQLLANYFVTLHFWLLKLTLHIWLLKLTLYIPPKRRWNYTMLHSVTSQKIALFSFLIVLWWSRSAQWYRLYGPHLCSVSWNSKCQGPHYFRGSGENNGGII